MELSRIKQLAGMPQLNEGSTAKRKPAEYVDSAEATDEMYTVVEILNSKRLMAWAKSTDTNYGTKTVSDLKAAMAAFNSFIEKMDEAS